MMNPSFLLAAAFLALATAPALAAGSPDPRLERSRALADSFQQALKQKLMSALEQGGPVNAIGVCKEEAPAIAAGLSARSGAQVGRTALRIRNPANAPDQDARAALEGFQRALENGAAAETLERFEVRPDGSARYMKAILAQPPCLACHGSELSAPVQAALKQHYPQDRATGFRAGDLRGAFLIDWPASNAREARP
ncbi:Tll0287-like domain-containing protein [Pelomicrobium sp.]|jgi:hypothetical protein|uniref:Tll0287-like domain-containing protein n=1 Tax=Pelomicrobium sp. TaxID=2815319 RepID=UPI002FDE721D